MHLLRKFTYGEFSEFVQEKKVHIQNILKILWKEVHIKRKIDKNSSFYLKSFFKFLFRDIKEH